MRKIQTLLFSTLYPSSARPLHGIFVETRLRELLRTGAIETKVLAPVPWFPLTDPRWGDYAKMASTPRRETRNGIEAFHPRYLVVPKVGMTVAPLLLAAASLGPMRRLIAEGFDFDVIDAHYYYPDGVAAAMLSRWVDKPLAITARGTDLNLIPKHAMPRRMIRWAGKRADASIGVCQSLIDVLHGLDVHPTRLHVMRNGVDLLRFRPLPQDQMRRELGLSGSPLLLAVGLLIPRKGHDLVIDALASLRTKYPTARLVIVGQGPEREALAQRAKERGVADAVTFAGAIANEELTRWYSAADVLVLASQREGWPNVLLEAMACGTPVVATNVGAAAEIVPRHVGAVVRNHTVSALAAALFSLLDTPPSRPVVRAYAEGFGWQETSEAQVRLFRRLAQPIAR